MKYIFLYVGHSNFGKSVVLKDLTNGNVHKKSAEIAGKTFKVRKMSNDDDGRGLLKFVKKIKNSDSDYYIIAYCPKQDKNSTAKEILEILKEAGKIFFFVQKNSYSSDREILENEIFGLKEYGAIEILSGKEEYSVRSSKFKEFVRKNLK